MSKELNKNAVELTKAFYRAVDKRVTPALMKQGIGQFKSLLNVYTMEELESIIKHIKDGHVATIYSPGYLSYTANKILDDIKLRGLKEKEKKTQSDLLDFTLDNQKKKAKSSFLDKFV